MPSDGCDRRETLDGRAGTYNGSTTDEADELYEPLRSPEPRQISARGVLIGSAIGLASGLLLDYLALFGLRLLKLPSPGAGLEELFAAGWFLLVIFTTTVLGALYYSAEN